MYKLISATPSPMKIMPMFSMLWKAIEQLSAQRHDASVVPGDAAVSEHFEAEKLNQLLGK